MHLNIVTKQKTLWIDDAVWKRSAGDIAAKQLETDLAGRLCCGGLDLSAKYDLTAFVLVFPDGDDTYKVLSRFWIPEETARLAERKHGIPYSKWERDGFITFTPGASVSYPMIEQRIIEDAKTFQLEMVVFDPWNANSTRSRLEADGIVMVEFPQQLRHFNEPTKEFGRLVMEGHMHHGGNPVMSWCVTNTEVYTDPSGNIRPVKPEDAGPNKIDGSVAGIMGLSRAMLYQDEGAQCFF